MPSHVTGDGRDMLMVELIDICGPWIVVDWCCLLFVVPLTSASASTPVSDNYATSSWQCNCAPFARWFDRESYCLLDSCQRDRNCHRITAQGQYLVKCGAVLYMS